jgi:hypothetical protein
MRDRGIFKTLLDLAQCTSGFSRITFQNSSQEILKVQILDAVFHN